MRKFADAAVTGMEQSIQRFLEATRQLDCFFIQKRMQVSAARPELTGKEVSNSDSFLAV